MKENSSPAADSSRLASNSLAASYPRVTLPLRATNNLLVIALSITICLLLPTFAAAKTQSTFSGDIDFSFLYNKLAEDQNLYLFSSLLNLEVEKDESPWTFYISYQLTTVEDEGTDLDPYRYWARYTNDKAEVRLGMQKIVFGHTRYLRPLRLFDTINPNDFLKKTAGTKSLQLKLFPREDLQIRTWTIYNELEREDLHFGGRVNKVFQGGEAAFTFHHWEPDLNRLEEDIIGFDFFADVKIGLWLEHATHHVKEAADYSQTTLGVDYTWPRIGNGLHASVEHMVTTDGDYAQTNRTSAFFFDTRLNDEDTLYGSYLYDHFLDVRFINMRVIRDVNERVNAELGFDWVDKDPDELPPVTGQVIPLRKGVTLRAVYSF